MFKNKKFRELEKKINELEQENNKLTSSIINFIFDKNKKEDHALKCTDRKLNEFPKKEIKLNIIYLAIVLNNIFQTIVT